MILPIAEFYPRLIPHPKIQIILSIILIPLFVPIVFLFVLMLIREYLMMNYITEME